MQAAQTTTHVMVTVNGFTNAVDDAAAYRTPMIAESSAEELTGIETAPPALLRPEALRALADGTVPAGRRGIRRSRVRYRADDLSGPLPLGTLESLGLPYRTEQLAVTDALLDTVLRRDGVALLSDPAAVLGDECGYLPDDDGTWWAPSGQAVFGASAGTDFYLPAGFTDPYGSTTTVGYDRYRLLPVEVTDALGNTVSAANDYRMLAPVRLTDPNGAVSEAMFDALGMVAATARRGRPGDPRGSTLDGVDPDPDDAVVAAYLADPVGAAAALLGGASTRLVYDPFGYARTSSDARPQAPVAATLARESYEDETTRIAQALAYSDGFGRALQTKALVAGGRWVASGWTIVNNKGLPVRQYEPFFTATHRFEPDVRVGVSPIVCYDPVGRVVATVNPDRSWAKVAFDAWRQDSWDGCDTVLIDPRTDPDVGGYLARLPVEDVLPTWFTEHATDPAADAHADTPAQAYLDPMGRSVLTVAHNRVPGGSADLLQPTLVVLDVEGNQRDVVDPLGRSTAHHDYDLAGQVLHSTSPAAGQRWGLGDATGQPRYSWNSRGFRHRSTYDAALRPVATYLDDGDGPETLVARTEYGESLDRTAAAAAYLLGRAYQVCDGAGAVTNEAYDFAGNQVTVARQLLADPAAAPDWSGAVALSGESFTTVTAHDALDRPVLTTAPDGSRLRPVYDESGLLTEVDVALAGTDDWEPYVTAISYTAKGQRERISYGNGTVTDHQYDASTQRLVSARTVQAGRLLQALAYTYDAVGNVVRVADTAQQTAFFRNTVVEPSADYSYDATYQLVAATGREHLGQLGEPGPYDTGAAGHDQPGDGLAMGRYTETYEYDDAGNILAVRHLGSDPAHPGWTRTYAYQAGNRLGLDHGRRRAGGAVFVRSTRLHDRDAAPAADGLESRRPAARHRAAGGECRAAGDDVVRLRRQRAAGPLGDPALGRAGAAADPQM